LVPIDILPLGPSSPARSPWMVVRTRHGGVKAVRWADATVRSG
jgi:hypothetical protein